MNEHTANTDVNLTKSVSLIWSYKVSPLTSGGRLHLQFQKVTFIKTSLMTDYLWYHVDINVVQVTLVWTLQWSSM